MMNKNVPYGRQFIDQDDINAVVDVLRSPIITQGANIAEFESALCKIVGARYATAVNSGTSALHIACMAAQVGAGDEVITSPITFVASANCALYCSAKPVFADIEPRTYNISPDELEKKIGPRTKAVIPVHFAGQSCDMEAIREIVSVAGKKYNRKIAIIEDASHALGSEYKHTQVGSCAYSDMAVMSFHPVKHITTGEGGVVFTNCKSLDTHLKRLRSHGITSAPETFISKDLAFDSLSPETEKRSLPNPWYYEQQMLGFNYRITNLQCALGISQLKKLERFKKKRREIVDRYNTAFSGNRALVIPFEASACNSNFHLYVLLMDFQAMGRNRAEVMHYLKEQGIITQVHYIPVHLQHYYRKHLSTDWGDYPNAESYYEKCLSIPLFPAMSEEEIDMVVTKIQKL